MLTPDSCLVDSFMMATCKACLSCVKHTCLFFDLKEQVARTVPECCSKLSHRDQGVAEGVHRGSFAK
jgi:hypothetical protein